jgi:uncharacterized protein
MRVLPDPDLTTQFYWDAAARRELAILRCGSCRSFVHYPREDCPKCGAKNLSPERVSGRGTIHSFTIAHHGAAGIPTPVAIVLVELEEQKGLRVLANLLECPVDQTRVGMAVEVTFEEVGEGVVLPQFRPRQPPADDGPTNTRY